MNHRSLILAAMAVLTSAPALAQEASAASSPAGFLLAGLAGAALVGAAWLFCSGRRRRDLDSLRVIAETLADGGDVPPETAPSGPRAAAIAHALATLAQARDEAVRQGRGGRQFLATASHDLRQPLQALGLFVATLAQQPLTQQQRAIVDKIESSLDALERLLTALLDISRIDAGRVQAHRRNFPAQDLFDRLSYEFVPLAADKALSMRFVPSRYVLDSDPDLLERILRNLLSNAVRYTERGGIVVGARLRGDQVGLEVWDSGIGIPAGQQEEAFREFTQLTKEKSGSYRGLGLGLAIVRRLAGLLGHDLEVHSVPGRGSVFRVLVPYAGKAGEGRGADGGGQSGPVLKNS